MSNNDSPIKLGVDFLLLPPLELNINLSDEPIAPVADDNSLKSKLIPVAVVSNPAPTVISVKSKSISIVPLDVIGEPLTSSPVPTVTATEVTLPLPVPAPISLLT